MPQLFFAGAMPRRSHRHCLRTPKQRVAGVYLCAMDDELHMSSWHHGPPHCFATGYVYFISAGTLHKEHLFSSVERREYLQERLLSTLAHSGWLVQAWAVLSNHYHFVAEVPQGARPLGSMLRDLHSETAREINRLDSAAGRTVWHQFRDTRLTYEKSWLARLHYVNENAVHHGLVREATQYPYCSAGWFEREANPGFYRAVMMTKCDRLNIGDDY